MKTVDSFNFGFYNDQTAFDVVAQRFGADHLIVVWAPLIITRFIYGFYLFFCCISFLHL